MPAYTYPQTSPARSLAYSPLDKLQKLSQMDAEGAHADALGMNSLTDSLSKLYGIQQEQEMTPEKIATMRSSNRARDFETVRGQQMLPGQIQEQGNKNAIGASEAAWAQPNAKQKFGLGQAQQDYLTGQKSGEMTPAREMEFLEKTGKPFPGGMIEKHLNNIATQKQFSGMESAARAGEPIDEPRTMQDFGPENLQYLKGLSPHVPGDLNIPPQYQSDPKIQKLLREQQSQTPYDPHLETIQRNLESKVHPVRSFIKDLWDLYS